jgi:hypothetical protein
MGSRFGFLRATSMKSAALCEIFAVPGLAV